MLKLLASQGFLHQPEKGPAEVPVANLFNIKTTFAIGEVEYGLNLTQISSEVKEFLEELIEVRISQDPNKLAHFLAKTEELPDDFFTQSLGQFDDPMIKPITLAQLNTALVDMINNNRIIFINGSSEKR